MPSRGRGRVAAAAPATRPHPPLRPARSRPRTRGYADRQRRRATHDGAVTTVMVDTGYPHADAQSDFQRQRRRQVLSQLAARLRRQPDDVSEVLPYDEVVAALGYLGERPLGLQVIPLDAIVGSVDRAADFDRWFRPRSKSAARSTLPTIASSGITCSPSGRSPR